MNNFYFWRLVANITKLLSILALTVASQMTNNQDIIPPKAGIHMKKSNGDHSQRLIAFGGVLNQWSHQVALNDTDTRRAVKFAVMHAKRKHPDVFPSRSDLTFTHKVKDISKLKLTYTMDGRTAAKFNALDPVLQRPVSMPIVWGIIYTFNVHIYSEDKVLRVVHYFSVLEYINEQFYILEHSFYCPEISVPQQPCDFGRSLCVSSHMMSNNQKHCQDSLETLHCDKSDNLVENIEQSQNSKCSNHYSENSQMESNAHTVNVPKNIQDINRKTHFEILSYNIWNTNVFGDHGNSYQRYSDRIIHLTKICRGIHPDVIAFQEVRFEDGKGGILGANQLHHLSLLLPDYQYVFQAGQVQTHGLPNLIIEGVAIFSRHPITARNHLLLTQNPNDGADGHQRVLLHAEIDIPAIGKIHILNTHLSLSHEARLVSVHEIWSYIQTLDGPVFLAGDFNAEAHNEEVQFLAGKYAINGEKTEGFHDIWELYHGPHNKGFTFNTLESELTKRIDLLFMKDQPGLALTGVEIIDDTTRGSAASSDHLGLLGKFAMQT